MTGRLGPAELLQRALIERLSDTTWADYHWSPVTGCRSPCEFCQSRQYARERLPAPYSDFAPRFHRWVLPFPQHIEEPSRIVVCNCSELFGPWVPGEWIEAVFEVVRSCPRHIFIFLTRNPARYADLDLPENGWYGTSIERAAAVDRIDALRRIDRFTYARFQPLLERIDPDLGGIDLAFVGGVQDGPKKIVKSIDPDWVDLIVQRAHEAGAGHLVAYSVVQSLKPGAQKVLGIEVA